jgi:hypothetical protein
MVSVVVQGYQTTMQIQSHLGLIATGLLTAWLFVGCASLKDAGSQHEISGSAAWKKLRAGMSYQQVSALLGPGDPDLREDLRDIVTQEREAARDFNNDVAAMGALTPSRPVLRSEFTVDRGDYVLLFRNGALAEWARF